MKRKKQGYSYNERLFSGDFRSYFHFARFQWCINEIKKNSLSTESVLELGCFDGKLIDFMSEKPLSYLGFDANWENGLDLAREKFKDNPHFSFFEVTTPDEMVLLPNQKFTLAVAMETLEHIPPTMVDGYLAKIAEHLNGYFLITVPNEKGIIFLSKWLLKKIAIGDAQDYTLQEIINATIGKMDQVARKEHKGFDYQQLIIEIEKYFDVVSISGHPFSFLPYSLCFGVGIVAKTKTQ